MKNEKKMIVSRKSTKRIENKKEIMHNIVRLKKKRRKNRLQVILKCSKNI